MSGRPRLLTVNSLTLSTSDNTPLVKGISFAVEKGEIVALVGESGSGKTLSSLAVMGLLPEGVRQTGGEVRFNDIIAALPGRPYVKGLRGQQIGMIFQEPMSSMNPVLKVGEQIAEVLVRHRNMGWKQAHHEAVMLLDRVGIVDPATRAKQYIHQLSGGMRQRVMIAGALCCQPSLLIADEPTTALDVTIQAQILTLLRELQRDMGMGVLFITHDLSVVARYADRAYVMHQGKIIEQGEVPVLLSAPQADYTRRLIAASEAAIIPSERTSRAGTPLVHLAQVTKSYTVTPSLPFVAAKRDTVLHATTLDIGRGEIVGLIGESGSGKTTLGRVAIGLAAPDSGSVMFDGLNLSRAGRLDQQKMRRRAQIIFQDPYASLDPKMTIGEQIAEPLRVHKLRAREQIPARVAELLELVGLEAAFATRLPAAFSGGQRQRIAIARALALEPDLLVADEAVSALDLSVRGHILALLARLRDRLGLTVLFISHDLGAVRQVCDRVVVLYRGKVVETGETARVLECPSHEYTRRLLAAAPDIKQALLLRDSELQR